LSWLAGVALAQDQRADIVLVVEEAQEAFYLLQDMP
jgi:hypothetical protein